MLASPLFLYTIAIVAGLISGFFAPPALFDVASGVSHLFMSLLKLVSLPIIFLSIVSVATSVENMEAMKRMGKKVVKYTLITTVIAASVALAIFVFVQPVGHVVAL